MKLALSLTLVWGAEHGACRAALSRQSKMLWLRWEKVELMPRRWNGCTAVVRVPVGGEGGSSGPESSGSSPESLSGDNAWTSTPPGKLRSESESLRETVSEGRVSSSVGSSASRPASVSAIRLTLVPQPDGRPREAAWLKGILARTNVELQVRWG